MNDKIQRRSMHQKHDIAIISLSKKEDDVRMTRMLLLCVGLIVSGLALVKISTGAPSTLVASAQKAADSPPNPAFEYLGTLRAETGTRTVIENGPQGTRTIVQVVG